LMYEIVLSFINSKRRPPRYVLLRYPKFLRSANASLKITTAATPYASLTHPPGALGDVPTSICLRILMYEIVLCFINSKRRPPRYVLLRYPKFLRSANASLKISTAATPYASLTHPPGALGDVPTSICLRIKNIELFVLCGATSPVAVPEIFTLRKCFAENFDRGHSLRLACSPTGCARRRPHFDMPAYNANYRELLSQHPTIISQI